MPCDYSKYPVNWKEIRQQILERANNKCEWCLLPNYFIKSNKSKVVLTIAHLDHDIKNNDFNNLRALCQKCHNIHDVDFRRHNRIKNKNKKTGQLELLD